MGKYKSWEMIANGVNAVNAGIANRSVNQLKKKWSKLKVNAQRRWKTFVKSRTRQKIGLTAASSFSETDKKILAFLGIVSNPDAQGNKFLIGQ